MYNLIVSYLVSYVPVEIYVLKNPFLITQIFISMYFFIMRMIKKIPLTITVDYDIYFKLKNKYIKQRKLSKTINTFLTKLVKEDIEE